ncbi:DUF262 domain-containing protein [Serinicoccus marinus]|uniref:DUF262 domain-containing protein n=1 Tax=Serinicoccus marinus TaxID=247333 RepID=UPI00122DEB6B|nr:DUF262 domain-containing protein [Serinicoccus marinus]
MTMSSVEDSTQAPFVAPEIVTVGELLRRDLHIPDYQRPYKWTVRNVAQLIDDVDTFRTYGQYRLGTLILHRDARGNLNIVDGQQRFTTFCLIALYLAKHTSADVPDTSAAALPDVGLEISKANVQDNYTYVSESFGSRRGDLSHWAEFFLDSCEVVVLTVNHIDEAFQMFDSQNTRGRALYPTDLLKAFHIREMSLEHASPQLRLAMVRLWEEIPPESIHQLFSDYLYKIKRWANGQDVPQQGFSSEHVELFKGIKEADPSNEKNRWARPFLYAKNYTDDYTQENSTLIRYGALSGVEYPFQIDHPVLNGETFFLMVRHYYDLGLRCGLFQDDAGAIFDVLPELKPVLDLLDAHRRMPTHQLVRNLFDCLVSTTWIGSVSRASTGRRS